MRVIVIGARGLLGTALVIAASTAAGISELNTPERDELDVTSESDVESYISYMRPDIVVHTAALMPADLCESQPLRAYQINTLGARWVSRACARVGALAVYISTDFVFDGIGAAAYHPGSPTRPMQTYGVTKLAGEAETRLGCDRHLVLRTAGLFGPPATSDQVRPCFVDRIVAMAAAGETLGVVDNIVMSPTYTLDLAHMIYTLALDGAAPGVYHTINQGQASWYDVARHAADLAGYPVPIARQTSQIHVTASRPLHTALAGPLPGHAGTLQRPWQDALSEYVTTFLMKPNLVDSIGRTAPTQAGRAGWRL